MKKIKTLFFILFALVLISGCAPVHINRLPAYDYALNMGGPTKPKLFYADTVKIDSALTPYAVLVIQGGVNKDFAVRQIWKKASELKADVVIIKEGQTQYAGTAATAMPLPYGGATAIAVPMYQTPIYGYCLRVNPSRIGFEFDTKDNMIIGITNESLRDAGILEGDKILAINNNSYPAQGPELLKINEGEDISITVIRPGTGKIEKKVKTMKNNTAFLEYSDAISWEPPPPVEEKPSY